MSNVCSCCGVYLRGVVFPHPRLSSPRLPLSPRNSRLLLPRLPLPLRPRRPPRRRRRHRRRLIPLLQNHHRRP